VILISHRRGVYNLLNKILCILYIKKCYVFLNLIISNLIISKGLKTLPKKNVRDLKHIDIYFLRL